MWIEEIFIENFGAYSSSAITGLKPQLSVIEGPNEAGKTTLMEFVRAVFFGYRKKGTRTNTYESPDGRVRGGRLTVHTGNSRLQICRVEKRGDKEGKLTILDDGGNMIEYSAVPVFGPGIQRNVYETLFAFDLDRMRQLDHEALREKIVAAALGSVAINPLAILRKLEDRSKNFLKRSSTDKDSLYTIQSRIGDIDKKLKTLQEKPNLYSLLTRELEQAARRRKELSRLVEEAEAELPGLGRLIQRREECARLVSIDGELETLERARRFPVDGIPRLEQATEILNQAQEELLENRSKLDQIHHRLASLNPHADALEHSETIYAVSREAASMSELPSEIERVAAELGRSRRVIVAETESLGAGWGEERVSASDPSLRLEQEIRVFLDSFRDRRNRVKDLQVRLSESEERCTRLEEKVASKRREVGALYDRCRDVLPPDFRALLQEWKNNLERCQDLHGRLSEQNQQLRRYMAHKTELQMEIENVASKDRRPVSEPLLWGAVCVILSMFVGATGAWYLNNLHYGAIFLAIAAAIFSAPIVAASSVRGKRRGRVAELRRNAALLTGELAETERRRRSTYVQIESLNKRSRRIAQDVLHNPEAALKDITDAETRSAAAEEPFRRCQALKAEVTSDLADLHTENKRKDQISRLLTDEFQALEDLRSRWEGLVLSRGLDRDLEPETAVDFVKKLRDLKRSIRDICEEQSLLDGMNERWNALSLKVEGLARLMNVPTKNADPVNLVDQLVALERRNREALAEQRSLLEKGEDVEIRISVSNSRLLEARDRIDGLYEAAGVADEESFRARACDHERFLRLDQERGVLVEGLAAGLGFTDKQAMREFLSCQNWERNDQQAAFLKARLSEIRAESENIAARCGSLEREIELMEREDGLDRLLAEKQEFVARMGKGVKELMLNRIGSIILERTLKLYELEKQPKVLERTSEIFGSIAGEGFKRVVFPLDGDGIRVERSNGAMTDEELLSRGTLEQLYLSLRLAHLDVYHRERPSIPILMDDVLVNFDPKRAKRTAEVLAEFSDDRGIQILFFTCHPHTAGLFPEKCPKVSLEDTSPSNQKIVEEYL